MCGRARAEQPRVAIEVILLLHRTDDRPVDDSARAAVPSAVAIRFGGGKEYHLVVLAHYDKGDLGLEAQFGARLCGRLGKGSSGTQGSTKRESRTYFERGGALP